MKFKPEDFRTIAEITGDFKHLYLSTTLAAEIANARLAEMLKEKIAEAKEDLAFDDSYSAGYYDALMFLLEDGK